MGMAMFKARLKYYLLTMVVFSVCCITVVLQPNRFQKFNSFRSFYEYKVPGNLVSINKLELESFVKKIPYKNKSEYVYSVYPEGKYEKTIINGYGDCSTMSFGAAYYILKNNIDFELIHFLPIDSLFKGGGHVVLRVPYNYNGESMVGIVDLAGGGLPSDGEKYLDVLDLKVMNPPFSLIRLNEKAPEYYKNYYKSDYLKKVYFGFTPSNEVDTYFKFINKFYISLGNEKVEKLIYDGLAILVGKYYSIYVDNDFIAIFNNEILLFRFMLYFIRVFLLVLPILILIELFYFSLKKKSGASSVA